jgi:CRISPR-associated protein Cmr2
MQHLLLIHIGPVQDFIASARRSRDLWFGSWLLSELSKAAARAIQEQEGTIESLIFPAPSDESWLKANSEFNAANKVVALIQKPPKMLADEVEKAVRKRLETIRQDAFRSVTGPFDQKTAKGQVDDLIEYFWVAVPINRTPYAATRELAEALMAARKSTRDFNPVSWGSNNPKSSLDGVRESVIPENAYPARWDGQLQREDKINALFTRYGARSAERLSGIDLLKRHGQRGQESRFPSTSHIASLPFLAGITQRKDIETQWNRYIQALPQQVVKQEIVPERFTHDIFGTVDGSVFFESRLAESLEGKESQEATRALRQFLESSADGKPPIPYYALLLADGDRMGQVINAQSSPEQHRRLSRALTEFAGQVQTIVEETHSGALVYAGGDDVLAFLPLHTAIDCARDLVKAFRGQMSYFKDETGDSPTFSAGLAVSHHLEPLSDALEFARQAEQTAKHIPGKNAIAVGVMMRGGVPRIVVGKWDSLDKDLDKFIGFHRQDALPDGAAYQLRDVELRLGGEDVISQNKTLQEAVQTESIRILSRKKAERDSRKLTDEAFNEMESLIKTAGRPIGQLAEGLIIARLFASAYDQAYGPLK